MKLDETISAIRDRIRRPNQEQVVKALKVTAGAAAAIWVALRLRRELYGPGGTKLSRYDTSIDQTSDSEEES